MAEFTNERLGVRFTLPDSITVRQQLQYRGRAFNAGLLTEDVYVRHWVGMLALLGEWECELVPDPKQLDLDTSTDPRVADIVFWVSNMAANHMVELESVPKNS